MRAITIWQPFCSLVLIGAKPYEFRASPYTRYVNPPKVGERIALQAGARPVRRSEVLDLIGRLEEDDPEVNPCLHREIALPFLRRVLAGLADRRRVAKRAFAEVPPSLFGEEERKEPASASAATEREVSALAALVEVEPFVCPHSMILCTARLGPPKRGDKCAAEFGRAQGLYIPVGAGAAFNWGWPLLDIEPLIPPVEAHGHQGFWEWRGSTGVAA